MCTLTEIAATVAAAPTANAEPPLPHELAIASRCLLVAGAFEFATYLPSNIQSVLVQPVGEDGVLVLGSDYQRGFGKVDQVPA